MKDHVAVLVPCYNESKTIEKVVRDFKRVLPEATVYVYDNNSSDGTGEIAARAGAVVRRERMQGKGSVIRRMFREIDADCYLMVDGDDTYPAEDAPAMVSAVLDEQADMVVGDRLSSTYFTENKRPFHNLGNGLVRASINHLFGSDIKDIMTGYRAFSYAFVKTYPVLSKGFEIETDMTIHAINRRMHFRASKNTFVPFSCAVRRWGTPSSLNTSYFAISSNCFWRDLCVQPLVKAAYSASRLSRTAFAFMLSLTVYAPSPKSVSRPKVQTALSGSPLYRKTFRVCSDR